MSNRWLILCRASAIGMLVVFACDQKCFAETAPVALNTSNAGGSQTDKTRIIHDLFEKNKFHNLGFSFTSVETTKEDVDDKAHVTNWTNGRMYLTDQPDSLFKIEFMPITSEWEHGSAPYIQENKSVAFNGKYWLSYLSDSGTIGAMRPCHTAEISPAVPSSFKGLRLLTPEKFFLTHALLLNGKTLDEFCAQFGAIPSSLAARVAEFLSIEDQLNGLIKVSIAIPSREQPEDLTEVSIDPTKGGALQRLYEQHLASPADGWSSTEDVVTEFIKVGGVYFPKHAIRTYKSATLEITREMTLSDITLLDSSKGLYEISLSPGTSVTDKRTDTTFKVGRDIDDVAKAIRSHP